MKDRELWDRGALPNPIVVRHLVTRDGKQTASSVTILPDAKVLLRRRVHFKQSMLDIENGVFMIARDNPIACLTTSESKASLMQVPEIFFGTEWFAMPPVPFPTAPSCSTVRNGAETELCKS